MNGCVFSIIGTHGKEPPEAIIDRKAEDIQKHGFTMWAFKSHKASPAKVQALAALAGTMTVRFLWPVSKNGAKDIKESQSAKRYSSDKQDWLPINGISSVGGNLTRGPIMALVFKSLAVSDDCIDLGGFSEYPSGKMVDIKSYYSTVACIDQSSGVTRQRRVACVGELVTPYCVWIQ